MQSTKEEYHLTRNPFQHPGQQQQEQQSEENEKLLLLQTQKLLHSGMPMRNVPAVSGLEKLLVVLLVASATVCLLTNLLVLLILSTSTRRYQRQGRYPASSKLALRYRLMRSQSLVGIFTASVVVFPLKLLSMSLLDKAHGQVPLTAEDLKFFTSEALCLVTSTVPLVATPLISLGHALAMYTEQVLKTSSPAMHNILIASRSLVQTGFIGLWILPVVLAILPLAPGSTQFNQFCYNSWLPSYWYSVVTFVACMTVLLIAVWLMNRFIWSQNGRRLWYKSSGSHDDTVQLIGKRRTGTAFHSARSAGSSGAGKVLNRLTGSDASAATMVVRTVDPPTFLDIPPSVASLINFFVTMLLCLPVFFHLKPAYHQSSSSLAEMVLLAESDTLLPWGYLLVVVSGAFTPVVHLMCDEALSGLGLELIKAPSTDALPKITHNKSKQPGNDNEGCTCTDSSSASHVSS